MDEPFELDKHLAVDIAERFDLPRQTATAIVREERQQVSLEVSIRETEARNYIRSVYEQEIGRFQHCRFTYKDGKGCGVELSSVVQTVAHMRLHTLLDSRDPRVMRDVAKDIQAELFPVIEKRATFGGILEPEERSRLISEFRSRGLIDAEGPHEQLRSEDSLTLTD